MKHWKLWLVILLLGGLVSYVALAPLPPLVVSVHKVQRGNLSCYIEEEGRAQLSREKKVFPTMAGYLGPVTVDVGDKVTKGQKVSFVDDVEIKKEIDSVNSEIRGLEYQKEGIDQSKPKKDEYAKENLLIEQSRQNLDIARKELHILETQFIYTEKEYQRILQLFGKKTATDQDKENIEKRRQTEAESIEKQKNLVGLMKTNLDIAQSNLAIMKDAEDDREYLRLVYSSQIDSLRARLDILKNNLKKTELLIPFDGVVLERITQGDVHLSFVTPDYYILKIGDLTSLEIRVDILSDDINKVKEGQNVLVYGIALGDRKLAGRVFKIYPSAFTKVSSLGIEQQRVTVIVYLDSLNDTGLNPGYRVDVKIFTQTVSNALIVSSRAIFSIDGKKGVFREENGKAKLRYIRTGLETDEESEVLEGLSEGDRVILDPSNDLKEDRPVVIR